MSWQIPILQFIMKNITTKSTTLALALLGIFALGACHPKDGPEGPNPNNPTEYALEACAFGLNVQDCERGFSRDSNYIFEGVYRDGKFYFGEEKRDEMVLNITPDNKIILNAVAESDKFRGVNASSSSRCINIVSDGPDHTAYHLEWVAEGESTITLWNGEGAGRQEISFKVTSRKEIPLEGIAFRYDGSIYKFQKVIPTEYVSEGTFQYMLLKAWKNGKENLDYLPTFELVGPIPLNATPTVLYLTQDFMANIPSPDDRVYGQAVSAHEYNLRLYKGYRWFPEYFQPEKPEGYQFVSDAPLEIQKEWQQSYLNSMLKLFPADLRERRIKLWIDKTSELRTGGFALYLLSEDAHVAVNESNNSASVIAHTTYQMGISGNK